MLNYKKITILLLLITYFVISSLFTNCRKPKTVKVEKDIHDTIQYSWHQDYIKGWDESFVTSIYSNGKLFAYGSQLACYRNDSSQNSWSIDFSNYIPNIIGGKLPVNKDCYALVDGYGNFSVNKTFTNGSNSYDIIGGCCYNLKTFDTAFKNIAYVSLPFYPYEKQIGINDSCKLLIYANTSNAPKGVAYYINSIYNKSVPNYSIVNVQKIKLINNPPGYIGKYSVINIKNNFIIGLADSNFLIRPNFSLKKLSFNGDPISTFNYFNADYILVQLPFNQAIYKTVDNCESWTLEYTLSGVNINGLINLSNTLIAINKDNIYAVSLTPTTINFNTLKNDGLTNKIINAVNLFNNKVYVSTNAGLYYKSFPDFINNN